MASVTDPKQTFRPPNTGAGSICTSISAGKVPYSRFAILVPAGTRHNIINGPSDPMKLYTLYAPPNHRDGVVHATKADAGVDEEHFDGKTTE